MKFVSLLICSFKLPAYSQRSGRVVRSLKVLGRILSGCLLISPVFADSNVKSLYQFRAGEYVSLSETELPLNQEHRIRFNFLVDSLTGTRQTLVSNEDGGLYIGLHQVKEQLRLVVRLSANVSYYAPLGLLALNEWHEVELNWAVTGGTKGTGELMLMIDSSPQYVYQRKVSDLSSNGPHNLVFGGYSAGRKLMGFSGYLANVYVWSRQNWGWHLVHQFPLADREWVDVVGPGRGLLERGGSGAVGQWSLDHEGYPLPHLGVFGDSLSDDKTDTPWAEHIYPEQVTNKASYWSQGGYGYFLWRDITGNMPEDLEIIRSGNGADVFIVQGSTNDMTDWNKHPQWDSENAMAFLPVLQESVEQIISLLNPVYASQRIWLNSSATGGHDAFDHPSQQALKDQFNAWLKNRLASEMDWTYIDIYSLLESTLVSDQLAPEYRREYIHWNEAGHQLVATAIDEVLSERPVAVEIVVNPLGGDNEIILAGEVLISVGVVTTQVAAGDKVDFDAQAIAPESLLLGQAGISETGLPVDIDADSDVDQVFVFNVSETGIACGDEAVRLSGETLNGLKFVGEGEITTFCSGNNCHP